MHPGEQEKVLMEGDTCNGHEYVCVCVYEWIYDEIYDYKSYTYIYTFCQYIIS